MTSGYNQYLFGIGYSFCRIYFNITLLSVKNIGYNEQNVGTENDDGYLGIAYTLYIDND